MKSQQVNVNIPLMIKTALIYLGLALSGWMLLKLIQACFWLPNYLNSQSESAGSVREEEELARPQEKKDL